MRYTKKVKRTPIYDCDYESRVEERGLLDKLGKLEDIEESMGVDLITFLSEMLFVLNNCNNVVGYTTDRQPILADYGYVEDFINRLKEAVNKKGELE